MTIANVIADLKNDPIRLSKVLWPHIVFYKQQRQILYSVWHNAETVVPAGHKLGKDFVTGFCCLAFFLTRSPCRILTTSVDSKQLEGVLWGEIKNFIRSCVYPLESTRGGPLIINHLQIRKLVNKEVEPLSYLIGRVAAQGEGVSGHHLARGPNNEPRTLFVADEASGISQSLLERYSEWAHRGLLIGNPYECQNYFKWSVMGSPDKTDRGGDIPRDGTQDGYHRKIIRIEGDNSPNVILAKEEIKLRREPSNRTMVPGVLSWEEYQYRLRHWDKVKQCVGLRARFWEGAESLLYPVEWLNVSEEIASQLDMLHTTRTAVSMGVDSGEGKANTSWTVIDDLGVLQRVSVKTPDTSVITGRTIALGREFRIPPEQWILDRGGGGLQHANVLREKGYNVRTIGFGERITRSPEKRRVGKRDRVEFSEEKYAYSNRRGEMYGLLRNLIDPGINPVPFAIPSKFPEYRQQMAAIPLMYDGEGRLILPPKSRRSKFDKRVTLMDIIGSSPDELDSLVLAVYGKMNRVGMRKAGAAF